VYTGPTAYINALFSAERIVFTLVYFVSIVATLYASLFVRTLPFPALFLTFPQAKSYLLCLLFGLIQICALAWYIASYLPGGVAALRSLTSLCTRSTRSLLPI